MTYVMGRMVTRVRGRHGATTSVSSGDVVGSGHDVEYTHPTAALAAYEASMAEPRTLPVEVSVMKADEKSVRAALEPRFRAPSSRSSGCWASTKAVTVDITLDAQKPVDVR